MWDNLRKVLLINTPINNAQGMSVLFGLAFGLPKDSSHLHPGLILQLDLCRHPWIRVRHRYVTGYCSLHSCNVA